MDPQARQTRRSTTATDDRPDARPAPQPEQPSAGSSGELVWRDMDGDQLRLDRYGDGLLRVETRRENVPGDPVILERNQVLSLYHTLADHLMATDPDTEDTPQDAVAEDSLGYVELDAHGLPLHTHHHDDGQDCVRTDHGEWVRDGYGIGADARCHRDHGEPLAEWERELLGDTSPKGLLQAALNAAGIDASAGQADHELVDRVLDTWQGRALLHGMEYVAGTPAPESITAEAERQVYGDRHADYGHPREDFTRTAVLWTGLLQHKLADGDYVDPEDVARCMIAVKLARDVHNPKRDNRVDMAGYALTLDRLETGQ